MNHYTTTVDTRDGSHHEAGVVLGDELRALVTDPEAPLARVNVSLSESLGSIKVGASVTLNSDQNERAIDRAGELARRKTLELLEQTFRSYGVEIHTGRR